MPSLVTGNASYQTCLFFWHLLAVAVQTEAHIQEVSGFENSHLANVAVTGLAIHTVGHMGAVIEEDEIWHLDTSHPVERTALLPIV